MTEKISMTHHVLESQRHRTAWIEAGPANGPPMIFVHGWPELGIVWRHQIEYFADLGWRCIAPDMRGYGGSSAPTWISAYAISEIVADMIELHDSLGVGPAIWIGHDWGSPIVWAVASHHADRCRGLANMCVPYFSAGFALPNLLPWINRAIYPEDRYPVGQWDYWLFYRERFSEAAHQLEADPASTIAALYRRSSKEGVNRPAFTADIRRNGGWFGQAGRAPLIPYDKTIHRQDDYVCLATAFSSTGFRGANAWYLNDAANVSYAALAQSFGVIDVPVLFLHAAWDAVCETVQSSICEPMRSDCTDLTEKVIEAGHELQLERPAEVNAAIRMWLGDRNVK